MKKILEKYRKKILENMSDIFSSYEADIETLYEPIYYALEGGKKVRPISVLLATELFGGDIEMALIPAISIEIFHNFTLLHDDVMDNSPLRRNRATVQAKWNANQAILSGDAMLILAYQKLLQLPSPKQEKAIRLLNQTGLQVCEGQQMDMEFETKSDISIDDYMKMIKLKTGVLIAASLAMGGIISDTSEKNIQEIYDYGLNLGLAFQIQDDYFDSFADFDTFGKKIGNDIVTNKKTFLYLKALEKANKNQKERLMALYCSNNVSDIEKIRQVKDIFTDLEINKIALNEAEKFYKRSLQNIDQIEGISEEKKQILYDFAAYILKRKK
jgi:geranylgeranyl diphosphate synthase type II